MSTRYNNGSHYENHQRAAELHDLAAHSHRSGEQHGKQDHLTGHEHSRQALEYSEEAHRHTQVAKTGRSSVVAPSHQEISARAYELWQAKGCPEGSAEEDWLRALEQLRS
jgi:hypothetical protein